MWELKHFLFLEENDFDDYDKRTDGDNTDVTVFPAEFRHVGKIHAIPAGN